MVIMSLFITGTVERASDKRKCRKQYEEVCAHTHWTVSQPFLLAASSLLGSIHPFSWFRPVPSCKLMNNALIMCARGCVSSYCLQ